MVRDEIYIAILGSSDGGRRFRTAIMAADAQQAREEAERIASDMPGVGVELVFLEGDDDGECGRIEPSWDASAC